MPPTTRRSRGSLRRGYSRQAARPRSNSPPTRSLSSSDGPNPDADASNTADLIEDRFTQARDIITAFVPHYMRDDSSLGTGSVGSAVDSIRDRLFARITQTLATSASHDQALFTKLELIVPQHIFRVEELRKRALQELATFSEAVLEDSQTVLEEAQKCASALQRCSDELHSQKTYRDKTSDTFALGVQLLILEDVVACGTSSRRLQPLYTELISNPPEGSEELRAISCVQTYPEDVVSTYVEQITGMVEQLERMPPRLRPRSGLIKPLKDVIQPIRDQRAVRGADDNLPPRGHKRQKSSTGAGSGAGVKRASRR